MKDYTLTCNCGFQGEAEKSLSVAKNRCLEHFKKQNPKCEEVFIDEYDSEGGDMGGGELTGRYWKVKKPRD